MRWIRVRPPQDRVVQIGSFKTMDTRDGSVIIFKYTTRAVGSAALLLSGFTSLPAADTTFVHVGDRVRLQAPRISSAQLVGEVTELERDTLVLLSEGGGSAIPVPISDLERIAVSQGTKSNVILGLLVGAGVGFASAAGLAVWACGSDDDGCTSGQVVGGVLALGAIVGGVGAGVGALIKTERWRDASIPASPPPVGLGFGADGSVRLALSLRL